MSDLPPFTDSDRTIKRGDYLVMLVRGHDRDFWPLARIERVAMNPDAGRLGITHIRLLDGPDLFSTPLINCERLWCLPRVWFDADRLERAWPRIADAPATWSETRSILAACKKTATAVQPDLFEAVS